jgi:hypothetical protein
VGIFRRKAAETAAPRTTVVVVRFADPGRRDPLANFSPQHGYAYLWPFAERPQIGQWAIAQGLDGPTTVVVGAIGLPSHARGMELKNLLRLVPDSEVEKAQVARDASVHEWLNAARRAAGLPTTGPVRTKAPPGFDPLPPVEGAADANTASSYGQVWWHAYKQAEMLGRDPDEIAAFKRIARGWYALHEQGARKEQLAAVSRAAESIDLTTAIRNVDKRSRGEVKSMLFAGKPLWDWLRFVEELGRQGRDDQALELVGALITAAEQEARVSGREPAPAYTERAAIIYRKRRDYLAEIAVIERWERACPPQRRGPGATQEKLAKRLVKARELAARHVDGDR